MVRRHLILTEENVRIPADYLTHNVVKVAIASKLYQLVGEGEIGTKRQG